MEGILLVPGPAELGVQVHPRFFAINEKKNMFLQKPLYYYVPLQILGPSAGTFVGRRCCCTYQRQREFIKLLFFDHIILDKAFSVKRFQ